MRLLFAGIAIASLSACFQSPYASAQDFDDRWPIILKAHAEPAPEEKEQKQGPPEHIRAGPLWTRTPDNPRPFNRSIKSFTGKASFYSYTKGKTASGSLYNRDEMTAAHRSLPFGTRVRVTDIASSRSVIVRIADRGPWIRDRVLALSLGAARGLAITDRGVAQVRVEVL
ncbi:septal ring lytic transglycosylase RlpA family protein [Bradyrhizobium sp. CB2312]|uniref:septal ring lytic transglycosylase RlpA family protein n=1 Tax=Bradyrhizobium sp. CB2312 TaxID=3039155 RepID=UPI0024B1ABA0|nr:septal ring lytic transglycosylase RlpA family protein [Bradyrhizobium sp. CB2312]WFU69277.1 septal ring lytic transglycosylase RlpA family protein [Bradyrhizobium sp. CB2312]